MAVPNNYFHQTTTNYEDTWALIYDFSIRENLSFANDACFKNNIEPKKH